MDLYDFFKNFFEAVSQDSAIDEWCKTNFGRAAQVFADIDSDSGLPDSDDMPYILLHSPTKTAHQEEDQIIYSLESWLAVDKAGLAARGEDNLNLPSGVELICDFATLFQAAVVAALPANFVVGFTIETDTLGKAPEAHAYIDADFIQHLTIGTNPMS